jgi:hypothetical protein
MRIIWQTVAGQQTEFEQQFLREVVLAQTPHIACFDDGKCEQPADDAVIIYSCFGEHPLAAMVDYLVRSRGYSLIHLSDERLQHDWSYYRNARTVLRSLYDPRQKDDRVFALPLGFQSGFLNKAAQVDFDAKDLVWCFAGQMKSHRRKMVAVLLKFSPNKVHVTSQWSDPGALKPEAMATLYERTIFAPCPFGFRNPDSFRVMEALEGGCIPVVLSFLGEDYFRFIYGDHPFIVARTWVTAAAHMRTLLADPSGLRARQRAAAHWYARYKSDLALDVRDILQGASRGSLRSAQFRFQKDGMKPTTVRLYRLYFGRGPLRRLFRHFAIKLS